MTEPKRARYRDALRVRDFRLLMSSFVIDTIGSWAYSVVISVEVFDRTGSTTWLAAIATARWGTLLALSAVAGVIADRYERTRLMLVCALANGVVMLGMALAVGVEAPIWTLLVLSSLAAAIEAPYMPAAGALTPELVDEKDLVAANGLFSTLENVVVVIGPLIGGLLLVIGSAVAGILVNAGSFFLAAVFVVRLRVRSRGAAGAGTGMVRQWWEGLQALLSRRVAFILVGFCALDSAIYGASSVLYVPLSAHLGTGLDGYGYLLAGNALGGVIAAALANRLSGSSRLSAIIYGSIVLQAVPFALTAVTTSPSVAFALQVVSGVGMIVVDVLALSALQRDVEGGVLSRVLAVFGACVTLATIAGSLGFAFLLQWQGLGRTLVAIGVVFPVLALLGLPPLLAGERQGAALSRRIAPLVDLLAQLEVFSGSPRPVLERLALAAVEQDVPTGAEIITEGEPADAFWVLAAGSLQVETRGADGAPRPLPPVSAPGYVGELGLLHGTPRTATVRAGERATLYRIDGQAFLAALEAAPPTTAFVQLTGLRWDRTAAGFANRRAPAQQDS